MEKYARIEIIPKVEVNSATLCQAAHDLAISKVKDIRAFIW